MRKQVLWASATLAIVLSLATGCSSSLSAASTSPAATCVNQAAPHHVYVVVQHLSGTTVQKCVGFTGDTIDGAGAMDASGLEYQTQTFSFGKAICQIDNEPAQFSSCFADNGPNWSLFVETGGAWTVAQSGYTQVTLHDREALGWLFTSNPSPAPPPLAKES